MGMFLSLFFIVFPIAEIMVLMRVAAKIGFFNTVILLVLSAAFGVYLAKAQGQAVLARITECLAKGAMPAGQMIDGMLIFIGGVLFIIPGFLSDILGLVLIFPPTRWLIRSLIFFSNQGRNAGGPAAPSSRQSAGKKQSASGLAKDEAQDAEIVE